LLLTALQYNYVRGIDPDTGHFTKACQALVDFAGLGKKIQLVRGRAIGADNPVLKKPRPD
jgi:hypothetical protein